MRNAKNNKNDHSIHSKNDHAEGTLVSICMPTYNGADYIRESLESLKRQSYKKIEVIVSDDHSKDNTIEIIEQFKQVVGFPVKIYHHKPAGLAANFNHCLMKACGDYIKFLFQDDLLEPTCIEEMVHVLNNRPNVGLVGSKRTLIIEKDESHPETKKWVAMFGDLQRDLDDTKGFCLLLTSKHFRTRVFHNPPFNKVGEPSAVMFRKSLIDKIGYFNSDLKMFLDIEYWARILLESDICILKKPLVSFRIHAGQATSMMQVDRDKEWKIYNRLLYKKYFDKLPAHKKLFLIKNYSLPGKALRKLVASVKFTKPL